MNRALGAALAAVAACAAPHDPDALGLDDIVDLRELSGTWAWQHASTVDGVHRLELERWRFWPQEPWPHLGGRYQRTVELTAIDGAPFTCVQTARYRLASTIELAVAPAADGAIITETSYQTEPSPCDRGLRHLTRYRAYRVDDDTLVVTWADGEATLRRVEPPTPPPPLAVASAPAGPWRWSARTRTSAGLIQHEDERWELTVGADGALAGHYTRTLTVRDPDQATLTCADAPGYQVVDRYLVRGQPRPDGLYLREVAVEAGAHRCLGGDVRRSLDEARVETIGEHLVLTWRGNRRQVLARAQSEMAGL